MMGKEASEFRKLFPNKHIPPLLLALFKAGESLRKKTETDHEDWLSRRLYNRLGRIYPFRDGPLDISLQPEIVAIDSDDNLPAGKIDFVVKCGLGTHGYFAIEAKRLRVRYESGRLKNGSSEYVNNGMMRFITGQYAPFMKSGAMLGYVYDGNTDEARAGVDKYIQDKRQNLKLLLPEQLTKSSILPDKPIDETRHGLEKRLFTIYHIFLSV